MSSQPTHHSSDLGSGVGQQAVQPCIAAPTGEVQLVGALQVEEGCLQGLVHLQVLQAHWEAEGLKQGCDQG